MRRAERGLTLIGLVFWLLILAAGGGSYILAPLYWRDFQLRQAGRARLSGYFVDGLRQEKAVDGFLADAADLGEGLDERNVSLEADSDVASLQVNYNASYKIPFTHVWRYRHFSWQVSAERPNYHGPRDSDAAPGEAR